MNDKQKARLLKRRTGDIFNGQKRRAARFGHVLDYGLDRLRQMVVYALEQIRHCPFCTEPLTERNFGIDHEEPISRGGSFELRNTVVCCQGCNRSKGAMNINEFRRLCAVLEQFPPSVRRDVLARLRSGGRMRRK
jgi:hypothetical protein